MFFPIKKRHTNRPQTESDYRRKDREMTLSTCRITTIAMKVTLAMHTATGLNSVGEGRSIPASAAAL